jgi:hypothetical protein
VDAFIASMLAGRLLADVYQPLPGSEERSFLDIFFVTQLTTPKKLASCYKIIPQKSF